MAVASLAVVCFIFIETSFYDYCRRVLETGSLSPLPASPRLETTVPLAAVCRQATTQLPVFLSASKTLSSGHLLRLKFGVIVTELEVAGASGAFPRTQSFSLARADAGGNGNCARMLRTCLASASRPMHKRNINTKKRSALKRMNRNPTPSVDGWICSGDMEHFSMAFQFRLLLAAAILQEMPRNVGALIEFPRQL